MSIIIFWFAASYIWENMSGSSTTLQRKHEGHMYCTEISTWLFWLAFRTAWKTVLSIFHNSKFGTSCDRRKFHDSDDWIKGFPLTSFSTVHGTLRPVCHAVASQCSLAIWILPLSCLWSNYLTLSIYLFFVPSILLLLNISLRQCIQPREWIIATMIELLGILVHPILVVLALNKNDPTEIHPSNLEENHQSTLQLCNFTFEKHVLGR